MFLQSNRDLKQILWSTLRKLIGISCALLNFEFDLVVSEQLSRYLAAKSEADQYKKELRREEEEIVSVPDTGSDSSSIITFFAFTIGSDQKPFFKIKK